MYVSIRDCMVAGEEFSSPVEGMRRLGIEAVELELRPDYSVYAMDSRELVSLNTDADAKAYKKHLDSLGIRGCCLLTFYDFTVDDVEKGIAFLARAVELADMLGMASIRVDPAMRRERELDFETRVRLFAQAWGGAIERTAGTKVALGIENHGFQGNNLAFQLNIYKLINSERMGSTMDTGNFYWRGYPLSEIYGILNILAPYAKHTHLKNIKYPVETRETIREAGWEYMAYVAPLDEGDIEHAKVARLLADAGYQGDLCIEDESLGKFAPGEERIAVLERDVAHVKGIIAAIG